MKPWLFVGAKVVCVDDSPPRVEWNAEHLVKGRVYTISEVDPAEPVAVALEGLRVRKAGDAFLYIASRFRPLHDNSKTIEAMRNLMLDATVRGKVSA
jgi:predicted thioredoxin/glutaredoxin